MKSARTQERPAVVGCSTCRGRGWLHVRTRPLYGLDALRLQAGALPREQCWDCGGDGAADEGKAA